MSMTTRIEAEGAVRRLVVSIDLGRDLAPQVAFYRELGIPWKLLCDLTGRRKQTLERMVERWLARAGVTVSVTPTT